MTVGDDADPARPRNASVAAKKLSARFEAHTKFLFRIHE
jgi:hypothetical protein